MTIWLIGAGSMAQEYCKVLLGLNTKFDVIGRGYESAKRFESVTGKKVLIGGLKEVLKIHSAPFTAIVAVGILELKKTAITLIKAGARRILLEKPGGLSTKDLKQIQKIAKENGAEVLIAYNRRFFASTVLARSMMEQDGGPTSCFFEFTEWSHIIATLPTSYKVKEVWFLANSTHVADLAFHLCGIPEQRSFWSSGSLSWHQSAARFCGAGITDRGVSFSYHANWEAPGRWGVEVLTRNHRFIFRPIEKLQIVKLGSVISEPIDIDDALDHTYKPGLYLQTKAFLNGEDIYLCPLSEQIRNYKIYEEMAGYA